jgi:hypothetical protein
MDWIALTLVILPVFDWSAVLILTRVIGRFPNIRTLRERRRVALAIAFVTTIFAFLGFARLGHLDITGEIAAILIFVAIVTMSLVNLAFVVRYWRSAWGSEHPHEQEVEP